MQGTSLKEVRRNRWLSQIELASLSGVSQSEISRIERGVAEPTPRSLGKLMSALSIREIYPIRDPRTGETRHVEILETIDSVGKDGRHYSIKRFDQGYLVITKTTKEKQNVVD